MFTNPKGAITHYVVEGTTLKEGSTVTAEVRITLKNSSSDSIIMV